jgi:AcrR family transcriptional regulator
MVTAAPSRREQILVQAADLFAQRGFHGVSVHDVGASCGISGPALYRHFRSKNAMLAEMLISISERLLEVGRQRVAIAADPSAALTGLISWHTEFALTNRALIVVQDRDWSSLPDAARDRVRSLQTSYVALWVTQMRKVWPTLTRQQAEAAAHAVFGLLNSTPHSVRLPTPRMRELLEAMAAASLAAASQT